MTRHADEARPTAVPLVLVTKTAFENIRRSRAKRDELLAKCHGLPVHVVAAVRRDCTLGEAVELCVPAGIRVRLDAPMDSGTPPEPQVGEWGTVPRLCLDGGGKLFVRWDGGSNLAVLPEVDKLSYLPPTTEVGMGPES